MKTTPPATLAAATGAHIEATLRGPGLPEARRIVAVTGWGQAEDRKQSAEAGFDLHLVKPVEAEQLQAILAGSADGIVN